VILNWALLFQETKYPSGVYENRHLTRKATGVCKWSNGLGMQVGGKEMWVKAGAVPDKGSQEGRWDHKSRCSHCFGKFPFPHGIPQGMELCDLWVAPLYPKAP
jgi:hypothetical protein